ISITSTIDHEVGNIVKCLKAGFPAVAMIGVDSKRLQALEDAVKASLGQTESARVAYFLPDDFLQWLEAQPSPPQAPPESPTPTSVMRRGYKVKRSYATLTPEERKAREAVALKMIAETMQKKSKDVGS